MANSTAVCLFRVVCWLCSTPALYFDIHNVPQLIPNLIMGKWLENKRKKAKNHIATVSLLPNKFHVYTVPEDGYNRTSRFEENKKNLRDNKHKGELSSKAQKRIENAINWLLLRSRPQPVFNREHQCTYFFRLNFVTLTLPAEQTHSDKEITSVCLNNFLNVLRKQAGVEDYLWKAEAQGNGRIHFHITTNKFIHWQDVRKWWKQSIELLGYVSAFKAKFHHSNPPCTEIRKVKHIRKIASYISKYLAKNKSFSPIGELRVLNGRKIEVLYTSKAYRDEKAYQKQGRVIGTVLSGKLRLLECNLWGCSRSVSKSVPLRFDRSSIQWDSLRSLINSKELHQVKSDYVDSYYGDIVKLSRKYAPGLYEDILSHARGERVSEHLSDDKILQYL